VFNSVFNRFGGRAQSEAAGETTKAEENKMKEYWLDLLDPNTNQLVTRLGPFPDEIVMALHDRQHPSELIRRPHVGDKPDPKKAA
jgi:hypothetical protein